MSLFDQISAALTGGGQTAAQDGGVAQHLVAMVSDPANGGLAGLVQKFEAAGAGGIIASWVGTGENQSVATDLIQKVLGSEQVQSLAQKTGLPVDQLLAQISQHLPGMVDGMTPNGTVPSGNALLEAGLGFLRSRLGGSDPAAPAAPEAGTA